MLSGGKKHFWGQRGKNYGFYTTPEEDDMDRRRQQHRRVKSEAYDYYSDQTVRYRNRVSSKHTLPTEACEVSLNPQKF